MALVLRVAVPARPVQLAEVVGCEARDGERAAAVVLEDLVGRALGAAARDGGCARGLFNGEGVLIYAVSIVL